MIELIGKNGSGKTYIANELGKRGYEKIVGYTTRPMRKNETDKVDYNFIDKSEFENMIDSNQFIDYKIRNGNYYGISRNGLTNTSIITSGNSNTIARITGFPIYKIYLDASLSVRYARMIKRGPDDNIFDRLHSENFSFLNDFQALFISNDNDNITIVDYIEEVINCGIISEENLKNSKDFIYDKVIEYETQNYVEKNIIVDILAYEEYILRKLSLMNDVNMKDEYYRMIKNCLENLKIKYTEEQEEILFSDNKKLYKLDYKER